MGSAVLFMSVSIDGFVADTAENPDRLHRWIFPDAEGGDFEAAVARLRGQNRLIYDELMSTGAVVAGRGTFEPARGWGGDHHDGVPIYILSRNPAPDWAADWSNVHYVSDLATAMREAKAAAGTKDVLVHGAGITQRALPHGLLDELSLSVVPVLLGEGRHLFDGFGAGLVLERTRVLQGEDGVVHLRFAVSGADR